MKKTVRFAEVPDVREIDRVGKLSVRNAAEAGKAKRAALRELRARAKVDVARTPTEVQSAWVSYLVDHPSNNVGMKTFRKNISIAKKGRMTPRTATQYWKMTY